MPVSNLLKVYSWCWIHLIVHTGILFRRILLAFFFWFTTLLHIFDVKINKHYYYYFYIIIIIIIIIIIKINTVGKNGGIPPFREKRSCLLQSLVFEAFENYLAHFKFSRILVLGYKNNIPTNIPIPGIMGELWETVNLKQTHYCFCPSNLTKTSKQNYDHKRKYEIASFLL